MNPPINGKTYMVEHGYFNPIASGFNFKIMLTKISFTAEVWVVVHQDHMVKYSSFEGNMLEIHFYGNENTPNWRRKEELAPCPVGAPLV